MSLSLTVSVDADEWAYTKRRLAYYEALLLRIVRESDLREWYSAYELALMALPGIPERSEGIARKASKEGWRRRKTEGSGRHYVYSILSLPPRTFDAMMARILGIEPVDDSAPLDDILIEPYEPPAPAPTQNQPAPAWVLPLMRIMKAETCGSLADAWEILPERLPQGIIMPSAEEAAEILVSLGLAKG